MKRKVDLAPPSQKKEVRRGPDFSGPKPINGSDEAVLAVDPMPIPLSEIPRDEGLPLYILQRNRPPPKPLIN